MQWKRGVDALAERKKLGLGDTMISFNAAIAATTTADAMSTYLESVAASRRYADQDQAALGSVEEEMAREMAREEADDDDGDDDDDGFGSLAAQVARLQWYETSYRATSCHAQWNATR